MSFSLSFRELREKTLRCQACVHCRCGIFEYHQFVIERVVYIIIYVSAFGFTKITKNARFANVSIRFRIVNEDLNKVIRCKTKIV